jgi:transmembrane sensor
VRVIGTAFNVKSSGGKTTVSVEHGIVEVTRGSERVELRAGQHTLADPREDKLSKNENNGALYKFYFDDKLVCDRTPLRELVSVLNQKFGTEIVITDPELEELPISTTFNNQSAEEILDVIAKTFAVSVERQGRRFLISK